MDYKARFYSPMLGRFLQPDSLIPDPANPQAWNRYSYVANNPVNLNDPTGHKWDDCSNVSGGYRCKIHMKQAGQAVAEANKKIVHALAALSGGGDDNQEDQGDEPNLLLPPSVYGPPAPLVYGPPAPYGPLALDSALNGQEGTYTAITITTKGLNHIFDNHTIGGSESEGQSIFFNPSCYLGMRIDKNP